MFSLTSQLRFFSVLLLGGLLVACSQHVTQSDQDANSMICAPSENLAVCYFSGAYSQMAASNAFLSEVVQALKDAIDLPLEELCTKRYVAAKREDEEPYQYTFVEFIDSLFSSGTQMNGTRVTPETKGFIEAVKQPEAIPELKKMIAEIEDVMLERCDPTENIALCFFARTNAQGDHSPEPLRDAIKDVLTLPLEKLRTKRYADYSMTPNMWTFEEVLSSTFTGTPRMKNGNGIDPNSEGFLEALKQPEAIPVLEELLADLEKAVLEYKELEDFRR